MRFFIFLALAIFAERSEAVRTRADAYQSSDNNLRRAKQRLLSMDPENPGIRYRVGDQLSKLSDVATGIAALGQSTKIFQKALAEVAGVIDIPGQNDGLVPQMKQATKGARQLDSKLNSLHKSVRAKILNLYNQANKFPVTLTNNLQSSLNNLVTVYNQQVVNQVHSLDRQRQSAMASAATDTSTLNRTITSSQKSELASVRKLLSQMVQDKVDVLSETADLNAKFQTASGIVNSALAGVKSKSSQDLASVQNIVDKNKQALTEYIQEQGGAWTNALQALIEKAAKQTTKDLDKMLTDLTKQFADAQKGAQTGLSDANGLVESSVKSITQSVESIRKKFNLSILNATAVTDAILRDLEQPIQDINGQVTAASTMMSSALQDATTGISEIDSNATFFTNQIVTSFQAQAQNLTANPGFAQINSMANDVYSSAQTSMQAAESSATARVAALEAQLGANDQTVGQISQSLQESISSQTSDFKTQTKVATANIEAGVSSASKQLKDLAETNAAQIDDAQADADSQLASTTDRMLASIAQGHDSAQSMVDSVNGQIGDSVNKTNSLISNAFSGVLSDSNDVFDKSSKLGAAANQTGAQIDAVKHGLLVQLDQVNGQLSSAASSIKTLQQEGANAVDEFSHNASAASADAVLQFTQEANHVVESFGNSTSGKLKQLESAQKALAEAQNSAVNQTAVLQAQMAADIQRAKVILTSIKSDSTVGDTVLQNQMVSAIQDFSSGSSSEVADLKADANAKLKVVLEDVQNQISGASSQVKSQTDGLVNSLAQLGDFVNKHSQELKNSIGDATGAVADFSGLVNNLVLQVGSLTDGLKLYYQNTSEFVNSKLEDTEQFLNETQAGAEKKIDETWNSLNEAMASVDGSTASKISAFKDVVNASISQSNSIVANFTNYLNAMVDYEQRSAASRLAIQRGLLASIIKHASVGNGTERGSSAGDMIARLQAVLKTASGAAGSARSSLSAQQAAQDALINSFGVSAASSVEDLLDKLSENSDAFSSSVSGSASLASNDSGAMLNATGKGVSGIVSLAGGIANSVDMALSDTKSKMAQSQLAMAALGAETNGLSNITQAQLTAVLQAMMNSQVMYSKQLDSARRNNSDAVATISGVIADFVSLVNQTMAESNELISTVDANYSSASEKLSSKMDTILGFISRESASVSDSAQTSGQNLKSLLTQNGAMEDGIRSRLQKLSQQQDEFAADVHDQLQVLVSRLSQDTSNMNSARLASTNKLVSTLQTASNEFASQASQWQSERLQKQQQESSSFIDVSAMSDQALIQDLARHIASSR